MNKLSRHVLGMKFMRKAKKEADKEQEKADLQAHKQATSQTSTKVTLGGEGLDQEDEGVKKGTKKKVCEIVELDSVSQCEGHIFGRQSFGGFNAELEANLRTGRWKPFYRDEDDDDGEGEEAVKEEEDSSDDEKDVSDDEMARRTGRGKGVVGSIIGTAGKCFFKKKGGGGGGRKRKHDKSKKKDSKEAPPPPKKKAKFMKPKD